MKVVSPVSDETGSEFEGLTARQKKMAIAAREKMANKAEQAKVEARLASGGGTKKRLADDFDELSDGSRDGRKRGRGKNKSGRRSAKAAKKSSRPAKTRRTKADVDGESSSEEEDEDAQKKRRKKSKMTDGYYDSSSGEDSEGEGGVTDSDDEEMPDAGTEAAEALAEKELARNAGKKKAPKKKSKDKRSKLPVDELDEMEVMYTPPPEKGAYARVADFKAELNDAWSSCVGREEIAAMAAEFYNKAVQGGMSPKLVAESMKEVAGEGKKGAVSAKSVESREDQGESRKEVADDKVEGAGSVGAGSAKAVESREDQGESRKEVGDDKVEGTGSVPPRGPMFVSRTRLTPRGPLVVTETKVTDKVSKELRKCQSAKDVFAIAERVRAEAKKGELSPMDIESDSPKEVLKSPEMREGERETTQEVSGEKVKDAGSAKSVDSREDQGETRKEVAAEELKNVGPDDDAVVEVPVQRFPGYPGDKSPDHEKLDLTADGKDGIAKQAEVEEIGSDDDDHEGPAAVDMEKGQEAVAIGDKVRKKRVTFAEKNDSELGVGSTSPVTVASEEEEEPDDADKDIQRKEDDMGDEELDEEDDKVDEVKPIVKEECDTANLLMWDEAEHYCESSLAYWGRVEDNPNLNRDPAEVLEERAELETVFTEASQWALASFGESESAAVILSMRSHLMNYSAHTTLIRMLLAVQEAQVEMMQRLDERLPVGGAVGFLGKKKPTGDPGKDLLMSTIRDDWVSSGLNDAKVATGSYAIAIKVTFDAIGTSNDAMMAVVGASMLRCNHRLLEGVLEYQPVAKYLEAPFHLQSLTLRHAGFYYGEEMTQKPGFDLFKHAALYRVDQIGPVMGKSCPALMAAASICRQNLSNNSIHAMRNMGVLPLVCSYQSPKKNVWSVRGDVPEELACPASVGDLIGSNYLLKRELRICFDGRVTVKCDQGKVKRPCSIKVRLVENAVRMTICLVLESSEAKSWLHRLTTAGRDEKPAIIKSFLQRGSSACTEVYVKLIHGFVLCMLRLVRRSQARELTKDDAIMFGTYDFSKFDRPTEEEKYRKFQVFSKERYKAHTGIDVNQKAGQAREPSTPASTPTSSPDSDKTVRPALRASDMF